MKKIKYKINENGCHICTSHYLDNEGYARIFRNGKSYLLHRYLWEQINGPIPKGLCVLHKCDNPSCININHHFLGTQRENIEDRNRKNRNACQKGENHGRSILTEKQVLKIRKNTDSQRRIAKKYGVGKTTINDIKKGKSWGWL